MSPLVARLAIVALIVLAATPWSGVIWVCRTHAVVQLPVATAIVIGIGMIALGASDWPATAGFRTIVRAFGFVMFQV